MWVLELKLQGFVYRDCAKDVIARFESYPELRMYDLNPQSV